MDTAAVALLITAVSGAILGIATFITNRKTTTISSRVSDTDIAFEALNQTVATLSAENTRIGNELAAVREDYYECEKTRKMLSKQADEQSKKISELSLAVEKLSLRIQDMSTRLSSQ